ncbi:MAG TPA: fibronectin type III domain-containing protein, partial [Capillimicrobium sp.]|nr:fibronectin type III domain-containing protein [Capillimicrobium sp.]
MKRLFATALTSTVALLAVAAGSASAACVAPYCPAPTATAPVVQNVTDTSADLSGTVAANGAASVSWQIQLGTSSGNYTTVVASGTLENGGRVSGTATGLAPNTTYYFRIAATSA